MKKLIILSIALVSTTTILHAQVAINNSAANPDASAILDLNTGNGGVNKGFLPPQVALTSVTVAAPVTSPATGLIVYSSTAPTGGNGKGYYYWNGASWLSLGGATTLANLTQGTGITAFSYNGSSAVTVGIANTGVTANAYGNASNYPTFTVNAQGQLTAAGTQALPTSLPPNGTAGGNLSGTYPNPTVSKINGASVPAAGTLTTGNVLQVNGVSSTTYGPVNIAGGANYITGNLPVSNLDNGTNANSTTFWRGDGTWASPAGGSISGSGTTNYLARWTPNSTTLAASVVQDDGTEAGIGTAPQSGYMLSVNSNSGTAIQGVTSTGTAGYFTAGGVQATLASVGSGDGIDAIGANFGGTFQSSGGNYYGYIGDAVEGAGAHFQDVTGNYAYLAYGSYGTGITAYGLNYGGELSDKSGDYGYLADNADHYGINAYGSTSGGYFSDGYDNATLANYGGIGVAGTGSNFGGTFQDNNGDYGSIGDGTESSGGTFGNGLGTYMFVCQGGSGYITNGSKSTEVKDKNNNERLLFCNESPEVMFEDYGEGQLVNGKAHITLDSLFAMNVAISEKHPLRVYIELLGDCNGTYVTNRSASGFDVNELNHGTSNTAFQWHIICNRANETGTDRDYAEKRFPIGPGAPKKPVAKVQPKVFNKN